jgi:release factor glutamine methyltransferase
MNVLELIQSAGGYLQKNGVESPRLQAEHLLAHVLRCRRMDLYLQFDRPVSEAERAPLRDLVRRRAAREPLQHLLGEWDFYGRTFTVDRRALIPRPETELLITEILQLLPAEESLALLDVGTGSGIIALTLALERPNWKITAVDVSAEALDLARINASRHQVDSIAFHQSDLLPDLPEGPPWQVVVANLPYIPSTEIPTLSPEVLHDPVSALDGGPDGLDLIRRLVAQSASTLPPAAWLFLEIGAAQSTTVAELFPPPLWSDFVLKSDFNDIPRIARARRASP